VLAAGRGRGSAFWPAAGFAWLELPNPENIVRFADPLLPEFLTHLRLVGVRIGSSRLQLRLDRHARDMTVSVLAREGYAKVTLYK
jgi:hypothetical protein